MDTTGLISLQTAVDDVLNELEEYSDKDIIRYTRFAERCVTELNIFSLPNVQTEILEVNRDLNMAYLPSDFRKLLRLGVRLNGKIYTLTKDEELLVGESLARCATENVATIAVDTDDVCVYGNASTRGGLSEYGTYRINGGVINFGVDVSLSEVILEYISSGIKKNKITYIPDTARESVVAYIKWKKLHRGNSTLGERQEAKMEYANEFKKLTITNGDSFDEIYDTLLSLNTPLVIR